MLTLVLPSATYLSYKAEELAAANPRWQIKGNTTCHRLGDSWLDVGKHCALLVTSATNSHTNDILLNPRYGDYAKVRAANDPLQTVSLEPKARVISLAKRFRAGAGSPS